MPRLVGRDAELASVRAFVGDAGTSPWVVLVTGEAGIGKTALWRALVADIEPRALVLSTRSTEAESALAFAALTDLLAPIGSAALAELPTPQREAIEAATLRAAPGAEGVDTRSIATGLSRLLSSLATAQPVVIALDDIQWLDPSSREVLEFAARRLSGPVGLLLAIRGPPVPTSAPVRAAIDPAAVRDLGVEVGPLTMAALHHMLRDEFGEPLPRPVLVRVYETSGGNPLFALELARALRRTDHHLEPGQPLPVPGTLQALTVDRLAALSAEARRALLLAAIGSRRSLGELDALGVGAGTREAELAGSIELRGGVVAFTHPLLASAAVTMASAPERRAAHEALAGVTVDPEERARHLALAAVGPDEGVAAALDDAVAANRARGATASAAELARLAVEHTEGATDALLTRMRTLGELLFDAGDAAGADHWYRRVLDELADPLARADVALRLANIVYETGSRPESTALARRAVDDAAGDPLLRARALLTWRVADHTSATRHLTRAARELLEEDPDADPITMAWALFQEAADAFDAGNGPLDVEAIDRALVLERQGRRWRSDDQVANTRAALLKFADRLDDARAALDELLQRAEEEGNFGQLPYLVGHLVGVYLRLGDYDAAATAADRHLELAEATGQPAQVAQAHYNLGLVALHQGDLEGAVEGARRLGEFLDLVDDVYLRRNLAGLLGGVAFVRGDITAAVTELERWWAVGQEIDDNPGISRLHGEFLDVLVLSGDVERATALLPKMEERASRAGAHSVLAALARSSATISAARGDLSAAFTSIDAALAEHDLASIPVERGRTLLLKGQLHRRAKEKSAARDALSEALALFERAGALAWAKRARDELRRVNIRPAAPLELTATERRIAELAIQGLTNKEIAAAAFLSPKTVEANLARIYRKLGIRSRVELAARGGDT